MRITKELAREIAPDLRGLSLPWEQVRDHVDLCTAGECDSWQLDTLTDWVIEVNNGNDQK